VTFLTTLLGFLLAVSLLVTVHELGHYWVARKLGFKVLRFSVGFGRPLWKKVAGADQTEYVFAAIPLGGYVKLLDEREGPVAPEDLSRSFTRKKPWQRILVLLAGPGFNFIFAILILWGMLWVSGSPELRPVVGSVAVNSLAAQAGLRAEDEILEAEGRAMRSHSDVMFAFIEAMSEDGQIDLTVQGPGGLPRQLTIEVADPAARRDMTEPPTLMPGLGMRFWAPPIPAVIGVVQPGGPATLRDS